MLILASQSEIRRTLLLQAGVMFNTAKSPLDETTLHADLKHLTAPELAQTLAALKAQALSGQQTGDYILGADQTCELGGTVLHKPQNLQEAKAQLQSLRGKTHALHTAFTIVENNIMVASHWETSTITMRDFSDATLDNYLQSTPKNILSSVGCYQLEGLGVQLMERIEGDYFAILGLPLLPLLKHLRDLGLVPS